jgi:hypothetical protein
MRLLMAAIVSGLLASSVLAQDTGEGPASSFTYKSRLSGDTGAVSPALENYLQGPVAELWGRPDLSARDSVSLVTIHQSEQTMIRIRPVFDPMVCNSFALADLGGFAELLPVLLSY